MYTVDRLDYRKYLIEVTELIIHKKKCDFNNKYNNPVFWRIAYAHRLDGLIKQYFQLDINRSKLMKVKNSLYIKNLVDVSNAFTNNSIDHVFVKGIAFSKIIYDDIFFRDIGDIDVLVDEASFLNAYKLLKELGYKQVNNEDSDLPLLFLGYNYHEIQLISKKNIFYHTIVELKRGLSAIDAPVGSWIQYQNKLNIDDIYINVFDINHSILLLFANTFANNECKIIFQNCLLREYFDIAYLIYNKSVDWDAIYKLSEQYKITHQINAVIKSTNEIYHLPEEFMKYVSCKFAIKNCNYTFNMFYYGGDKEQCFNSGLLYQRYRANAEYSIFDKDFRTFEFIKNYKAVLYSNKNIDYKERIKIHSNEETHFFNYKSCDSRHNVQYKFICKNSIKVMVKLEKKSLNIYNNSNELFVRLAWYDNDITSCLLQCFADSEYISTNNICDGSVYITHRDYYTANSEYSNDVANANSRTMHLNVIEDESHIYYTYSLEDELFNSLDCVAFEVKIMQKHNEHMQMSMGSQVVIIEDCG